MIIKTIYIYIVWSQLKPTEFLNLDVILEGVMNRLVLRELREHVYSLLVDEYVNNGSIPSMVENIHYAKSKCIQDFAVRVIYIILGYLYNYMITYLVNLYTCLNLYYLI